MFSTYVGRHKTLQMLEISGRTRGFKSVDRRLTTCTWCNNW